MKYLNLQETELLGCGALYTAKEIEGQPALWKQTAEKFYSEAGEINIFLQAAYSSTDNIILSGAGTSAFIGLSLQGIFSVNTNMLTRAVATTDIVSHPQHYFNKTQTPFIISFARSGNSPESCAALELADKFSKKCFHLIITCDENGALAKYKSCNATHVFVLPKEANDKSLAMTGSYTSMLLTGLLMAYIKQQHFCKTQINLLVNAAEKILSTSTEAIKKIAQKDFHRAVFLGSGGLFGTATEAALKLQELTDGQIICKADTYLGFRHGPKAVIDENTIVIYFFSNNKYVQQYEIDLVNSMKIGNTTMFQLGVCENITAENGLNMQIDFGINNQEITEDFLTVCSILPGQLLGFYKSLQLGLLPDAPSVSGAISRVVEGVHIYPVTA